MEVGPFIMDTLLKMVTSSQRSVLHIRPKPKEITAKPMNHVNPQPEFRKVTSLVELMASLPRGE